MSSPLSSRLYKETLQLPEFNNIKLANLCGEFHQNIALIENYFNIKIKFTDDRVILSSMDAQNLNEVKQLIANLYALAHHPIRADDITHLLSKDKQQSMTQQIKLSRKTLSPRNSIQAEYLEGIDKHVISFAVGPAGTGKTYLAVAKAIEKFEKGEVQRLVFVRPAVEAGEKLGFLPGDLVEKVLPYLRPIYDALYEMVGFKDTQKLMQSDVIEVLPLAFMRGRTLNEAFIILDEAQNTTVLQMKMFLTRIGFGSQTVVTGDMTQVDLPKGTESGLAHAIHILEPIDDIGIHHFSSREVVRHPLISRIIDCYDDEIGKKK